jgi:hypothetical protein
MPGSRPKIGGEGVPRTPAQSRYGYDLDYRDTVFVYKVTMTPNSLGENVEVWAEKPVAIRASFQEHALDSQHIEPTIAGSRSANLFTRERNAVAWHDKVICRGITMMINEVIERFDNFDGSFHHTELNAEFLDEPGSVNRA